MTKAFHGGVNKAINNFRLILESLDNDLIGALTIKDIIKSSDVTARKYVNVLKETNAVESCYVADPNNGQKSIRIKSKNTPITDDLLNMLRVHMFKKYVEKYQEAEPENYKQETAKGARVYTSNDRHWHIEKKKPGRVFVSGSSLSAVMLSANY